MNGDASIKNVQVAAEMASSLLNFFLFNTAQMYLFI